MISIFNTWKSGIKLTQTKITQALRKTLGKDTAIENKATWIWKVFFFFFWNPRGFGPKPVFPQARNHNM